MVNLHGVLNPAADLVRYVLSSDRWTRKSTVLRQDFFELVAIGLVKTMWMHSLRHHLREGQVLTLALLGCGYVLAALLMTLLSFRSLSIM